MITIYCDGSFDSNLDFGTWACVVITPKNKQYVYTGSYQHHSNHYCERMAIVKALGKVKYTKGRILVYTDLLIIPELAYIKKSKRKKYRKRDGEWALIWAYIDQYNGRLSIQHVPRDENPAHTYALYALRKLRKGEKPLNFMDISPGNGGGGENGIPIN